MSLHKKSTFEVRDGAEELDDIGSFNGKE